MTDNVNVTLTIAAGAAATSTGDPSGGSGKILSGVSISPEKAMDKEHGKDNDFKVTFSLSLPPGMSATITNFRYYNNGSNKADQLGWWSPGSTVPRGISPQPTTGTTARLPDTASNPGSTPTNPTGGAIKYQGTGKEFEWKSLNDNKLVIKDLNNNVMDYYYVVEFQVTAPASLAGTYVHDPRIKNW